MARLEAGTLTLTPQPEDGATYARKIEKSETRIDWARPAKVVHDHIRGLSPLPGAWCEMEIGSRMERVKVLRSTLASGSGVPGTLLNDNLTIACSEGAVRLTELQKAGGKVLGAGEFLRGTPISKVV
jgi:methionyl-tRNA formyltransferase